MSFVKWAFTSGARQPLTPTGAIFQHYQSIRWVSVTTATFPPLPFSPPLPSRLSQTTASPSPWLFSPYQKPLPAPRRGQRPYAPSLRISLSSLAACLIFDRVAVSNANTALIEILDIAAHSEATSVALPTIKVDWRHRDKQSQIYYSIYSYILTSVSSPSNSLSFSPS